MTAIDFSGWPLYTHERLPEEIAYRITRSLDVFRVLSMEDEVTLELDFRAVLEVTSPPA